MANIVTAQQMILDKRAKVIVQSVRQQFDSGFLIISNATAPFQSFSLWGGDWERHLALWMSQNPQILLAMQRACGSAADFILGVQASAKKQPPPDNNGKGPEV